jgi:hypothetical protein
MQFDRLKRRQFITLLGGGAVTWPLAARGQQQGRIPHIGIIDDAPVWNAFRQGLRDLGYLEGQNIAFEYRTANGVPERLAEAATDLARRPVDVIATYGTPQSIAAKAATTTIPIVMIGVGDVLRTGLVPCPSGRQHHRQYHPRPGGAAQAAAVVQGSRPFRLAPRLPVEPRRCFRPAQL